jgi:hypothetical protein
MVVASLPAELVFPAFDAVPANHAVGARPVHFEWNYTTFRNIVFLCVAGVVWWLARNKQRFGRGVGYAIDPAQFEYASATAYFCATAAAHRSHGGIDYRFCGPGCAERCDAQAAMWGPP